MTKRKIFLVAFILALIVCLPLFVNKIPWQHDIFFHLSRLEGLATSIKEFNFFPRIYLYKNTSYGYASPLFYCDIFLYVPALLYIIGVPLLWVYVLTILICTLFSIYNMGILIKEFHNHFSPIFVGQMLFAFCQYRFLDIHVRGAFGEIFALIFIPLLLKYLYRFVEGKSNFIPLLLIMSLILYSHNISFVLCCILIVLYIIIEVFRKKITATHLKQLCVCAFVGLAINAWYIFPLLEQLFSQQFIDIFSQNNILYYYAYDFIDYFTIDLTFITGTEMVTNIGPLLTLSVLSYFLLLKTEKQIIFPYFIISIIFLLMIFKFSPNNLLNILSFVQFPWRYNLIIMCAAPLISCFIVPKKIKDAKSIIIFVVMANIGLVSFYYYRCSTYYGLYLNKNLEYHELIDGTMFDPYYGGTSWVTSELASGNYLPANTIAFNTHQYGIYNTDNELLNIAYSDKGQCFQFYLNKENENIVLPKTWYKGYSVYHVETGTKFDTQNFNGLVNFNNLNYAGEFRLVYSGTLIQHISYGISVISIITLIYFLSKHRSVLS